MTPEQMELEIVTLKAKTERLETLLHAFIEGYAERISVLYIATQQATPGTPSHLFSDSIYDAASKSNRG